MGTLAISTASCRLRVFVPMLVNAYVRLGRRVRFEGEERRREEGEEVTGVWSAGIESWFSGGIKPMNLRLRGVELDKIIS